MKSAIVITGAALQLAVLIFMAAEREIIVRSAPTVYLRTMPVDPRDIFRGDYVRLRYEVSDLPLKNWQKDLYPVTNTLGRGYAQQRDKRVYTVLDTDENGVGMFRYVTGKRPDENLFIRGRTDRVWPGGMAVRYGLEAFFVEQGKGLDLERARTREDRIRVPLEMEVAVGRSGTAVLKGYRWCDLGLGLTIESDAQMRPVAARLTLLNASDKTLAVVDLPGGASFSLEQDLWNMWQDTDWHWIGRQAPDPGVLDEHVIVLEPNDTREIVVRFDDPAWFVAEGSEPPVSLSERARRPQRFRFVYRPPTAKQCSRLQHADLIWHGHLHSSAFSGANVD